MDRAEYLSQLHAQFGVARADVVSVVQRATGRTVAVTYRVIRGDECEVHRVELTDGSAVYLRVAFPRAKPSKTFNEAWAMGRAREKGVPAPAVLANETIHTHDGERTAMVIAEAPGHQLHEVLPSLCPEDRATVMNGVGRLLGVLHSISMPGAGVPDEQGVWTDPETHHRSYVANCLVECEHLTSAGLTPNEVDRVVDVLKSAPAAPAGPVLCHGDVSPHHVFIDRELQVVGLIDWGMWHAGSAVSELAGLALTSTTTDFHAIQAGHGNARPDSAAHRLMSWHAIAQATHQIAWLLTSGQSAELDRAVTALRNALSTSLG